MAKVLVTGSTGFIGKRLVYKLLDQGHEVYALARFEKTQEALENSRLHIIYGDIRDLDTMGTFPDEIDAAYFLIHSLASDVENLIEAEKKIARNFLALVEKTTCKQIIFLGGIVEDEKKLSPHLLSRLAVEKVLVAGKISCTILRSSIIIGAGSASFEIIRDLVEKLPLMIGPKWVNSLCQPISVIDVIFYLEGVLLNPDCYKKTFDLGGPDVLSFKQVLLKYAKFRKLRRLILNVPVLTPRLSSYWLLLITSVRFSICRHLVESMKQNTRKLNKAIDDILPHTCLSYAEALSLAFQKIAQNEVLSTWMNAWDLKKISKDLEEFVEVPQEGCFKDVKVFPITVSLEECKRRIWSIGGDQGWYSMNWAWRIRGFIDRLIGGIGLNRGRRHPSRLEIYDSIDFWRVLLLDDKNSHIMLYAEMKLPGEAWLEFEINESKKLLTQTATFRPVGIFGRLYWYVLYPFHRIIFKNMAKAIAQGKGV